MYISQIAVFTYSVVLELHDTKLAAGLVITTCVDWSFSVSFHAHVAFRIVRNRDWELSQNVALDQTREKFMLLTPSEAEKCK